MNYRNDSTVWRNDIAKDKWRWEKKEWENDKCQRGIDEERKDEKSCWKEIFEEEKELWYDNVRSRQRKGFKCTNFYEISHRWHDVDLKHHYEIFFRIRKSFKERVPDANKNAKENRWMNFFSLFDVYINRL